MKICILILTFNRVNEFKRVFFQTVKNTHYPILINIDGPRNEDDKKKQDEIIDIIKKVDRDISVNYNESNQGCGSAIPTAVTWALGDFDSVIILEDDILPCSNFFKYITMQLIQNQSNSEIFSITGHSLYQHKSDYIVSLKSSYPSVWGWGIWKDRWIRYLNEYEQKNPITRIRSLTDLNMWCMWSNIISDLNSNTLDTWDYQLAIYCYKKNLKTIIPSCSLTTNIGNTSDSTHSIGRNEFYVDRRCCSKLLQDSFVNKDLTHFFEKNVYGVRSYYFIKYFFAKLKNYVW